MKRTYQQLLPMDETTTVKEQFGWLPLSIFKPARREDWRELIGDDGDETTRRSTEAEYLPGLRFSEFHPHLAEVVIRYWSLENDLIVDPFAGRATRGIVALELDRRYEGYEVAKQTFKQSYEKLTAHHAASNARLWCLDGCELAHTVNDSADLIFTCPPYHRLEKYQSAASQLSDLPTYEKFIEQIVICAKNCFRVLKREKFLCWVCADWRDGIAFRLFHADSLRIFQDAGFVTHDVVIVHNNSPFAPLQAGKVAAKRYTSKTHEYLLVFRKP